VYVFFSGNLISIGDSHHFRFEGAPPETCIIDESPYAVINSGKSCNSFHTFDIY